MGKRASAVIANQRTSIPFGRTTLAIKRPHFRKPPHLQESEALSGQTEPRTRKGWLWRDAQSWQASYHLTAVIHHKPHHTRQHNQQNRAGFPFQRCVKGCGEESDAQEELQRTFGIGAEGFRTDEQQCGGGHAEHRRGDERDHHGTHPLEHGLHDRIALQFVQPGRQRDDNQDGDKHIAEEGDHRSGDATQPPAHVRGHIGCENARQVCANAMMSINSSELSH